MMEEMKFPHVEESVYKEVLNNGLTVVVVPKDDFNKTFATFTTNYGSIDDNFVPIHKDEYLLVPEGIAHFLEHKLFEKEEEDVFQKLSKQGATVNAFTSFTRTAYLFSSTEQVEKNLETLIDFVQEPYFTDASVEKEKGIIAQEIKMYDDNADWRVYYGAIASMFEKNPVRIDIAGTVESIQKITKELLYECYHTFYHPSNMMLLVVGPIDPVKILALVKENQSKKTFDPSTEVQRKYEVEGEGVYRKQQTLQMPVITPKIMLGIKNAKITAKGDEWLVSELSKNILLQLLFGEQSENYATLYKKGWIDDSFAFDYTEERSFGFALLGGDTQFPDELEAFIREVLLNAKNLSWDESELKKIIRKKTGGFLMSLNSPEFIANQFTRYAFNGANLFDVNKVLSKITVEDIKNTASEWIHEDRITCFRVLPK